MQRKRAPYWLTFVVIFGTILAFFYVAALLAGSGPFVAVGAFGLAMVVFYVSELR